MVELGFGLAVGEERGSNVEVVGLAKASVYHLLARKLYHKKTYLLFGKFYSTYLHFFLLAVMY